MNYYNKDISKYSDPNQVAKQSMEYFGKYVPIYLSSRKDKKYMLRDEEGKLVHFGQYGMEDYTKHKDPVRRERYIKRAS
jgi:hypothetical protein